MTSKVGVRASRGTALSSGVLAICLIGGVGCAGGVVVHAGPDGAAGAGGAGPIGGNGGNGGSAGGYDLGGVDGGPSHDGATETTRDAGLDLARLDLPAEPAVDARPDAGPDAGLDAGLDSATEPAGEPAADAGADGTCSVIFSDDFESGTLAAWDSTLGASPTVGSLSPLAGAYSAFASVGTPAAMVKNLPSLTTKLRLQFKVTAASAVSATPFSAVRLAYDGRVPGSSTAYSPVEILFANDGAGSRSIKVIDRIIDGVSTNVIGPLLADIVTVRIEWVGAGDPSGAAALRVYVDDVLYWTGTGSSDTLGGITAVEFGTFDTTGTGLIRYDNIVVDACF